VTREVQVIVDTINKSLRDLFGSDIVTGQSIFRVIWSEDEIELRYGTFDDISPAGVYLRTVTETRTVPKYRQWIHAKHILERLVLVPEFNQQELGGAKISYEPLWVFEDRNGNYLPPRLDACKLVIDTVLATQNVAKAMITGDESVDRPTKRYSDPEGTQEASLALKEQRIDKLVEELFGDESGLSGATLAGGSGIFVPPNYTKE